MTAFVETRHLPAMTLVGLSGQFVSVLAPNHNADDAIPQLWGSVFDALDDADEFEFGWAVGLILPSSEPNAEPGQMEYFAGLVVDSQPDELGSLEVRQIKESNYVVCEHLGSLDELAETTKWFYEEYLPSAGFAEKVAPHIEVYDERFDPESSESVVMICAPIED